MRKLIGWLLLLLGAFFLGVVVYKNFFDSSQHLSPIPNNDLVKVLFLSPQPKK